MSTSQISEFDAVQSLRELADNFTAEFAKQHPDLLGAKFNFALIVEAHRRALPVRAVQCLRALSFSMDTSEDDNGLRFMLWQPITEYLQKLGAFVVEIEEWLCSGEVALAYLDRNAADFVMTMIVPVERARLKSPFPSENWKFGVTLNTLNALELELIPEQPRYAAIVHQIRQQNRPGASVPNEHLQSLRNDLVRLIDKTPEWMLDLCFKFLSNQAIEERAENGQIEFASQDVLAKDWLTEEEGRAWRDL